MLAAPRLRLIAVNSRFQPRFSMSSRSRAGTRLTQISNHLDPKPFLELNTPFHTERSTRVEDGQGIPKAPKKVEQVKQAIKEVTQLAPEPLAPKKMSNQAPHPALLIPGPIEFDDAVLSSMSHYRYGPISTSTPMRYLHNPANRTSDNPL